MRGVLPDITHRAARVAAVGADYGEVH
jgi:hypothetical protein